jgi:hypothetical protein
LADFSGPISEPELPRDGSAPTAQSDRRDADRKRRRRDPERIGQPERARRDKARGRRRARRERR